MDEIVKSLVEILDSGLSFLDVGKVLLVYFFTLWLLFSIWVFLDSRNRYDNILIPITWFFVVLFLNFPFLIFYLITRPEEHFIAELIKERKKYIFHKEFNISEFKIDENTNAALVLKVEKLEDFFVKPEMKEKPLNRDVKTKNEESKKNKVEKDTTKKTIILKKDKIKKITIEFNNIINKIIRKFKNIGRRNFSKLKQLSLRLKK